MNVSMTVGDIIVSAVISLIAGVITGIITGYGVTIYYRNKDEETQRKIENTKIKIFCEEEPKGMLHIIELADILKKYR